MGLVASKTEKSPLTNLCKERKELIRAARDARYYLATAHVMYFQSLVDFGNALNQFVQKELTVIPISSDDDDSSSESSLSDHDSDDLDSLLCSPAKSVRIRPEVSARQSASARNNGGCGDKHCLNRNNGLVPVMKHDRFKPKPQNSGHACVSSNNVRDHWNEETYNPQEGIEKSNGGSVGFDHNEFASEAIEMLSGNALFNEQRSFAYDSSFPAAPPQPSVRAWDFLDVFNVTDYVNCDYTNVEGEEGEEDEWREVREREGIPDLEDESKVISPVVELKQQKKQARKVKKGSCNDTTVPEKTDTKETETDHVSSERDAAKSPVASAVCPSEYETAVSVSRGGSVSLPADEDNSSESLSSCTRESDSRDLRHIVNQIGYLFETMVTNGERVSALLEVGMLPHQNLGAQFKDFASRVLGSRNSTHKHLNRSNSSSRAMPVLTLKSNFLSASLEKLCIWEKKLFEEVLVEEKLRVSYDKEYQILKNLDLRGAESSEIDAAEASVTGLLSKINVSVRAVESISRRVHKIRDEEMLFQLLEIMHELKEMWEFSAECHHKQFWAVARSRSCVHIVGDDVQKKPSLKATRKLVAEIERYEVSFTDYVAANRSFVGLLNEWLARNILKEQDNGTTTTTTPSVSPATSGAPEIFRLCKDWWNEIERVSEAEVCGAIQGLSSRFRAVEALQAQEASQRVRAKLLQKEIAKETKSLQEVWGVLVPLSDSAEKMITRLGGVGQDLASLRETMAREEAKHEKVICELNDAVSMSLQEGLVQLFEALEGFCLWNVKAYQNIRVSPNTVGYAEI